MLFRSVSPERRANPSLSVVLPMHNEERGLDRLFARLLPVLRGLGLSFEIVAVDDGSRDGTLAGLKDARAAIPELKIVALSRNFGKEIGVTAGLGRTTGDVVVVMDSDLQHPPESIPALVDTLVAKRWDFLSACRFPLADKAAMGLTNQIGNMVLTVTAMLLFFTPIKDSQSGMWVFKRSLLEKMKVTSDGMPFKIGRAHV